MVGRVLMVDDSLSWKIHSCRVDEGLGSRFPYILAVRLN